MKKVILLYEHINREYDSILRIAEELKKNRQLDARIFSIVFEWRNAVQYARNNGIDAVAFPWIYSDRDFALAKPFLDINPTVIIINLHQEQTGSPFTDPLLLPHGKCPKNACHHFAWGDHFARMLRNAGVRPELIHITGSARMDVAQDQSVFNDREQMSEMFSLDPNKRWLLYAEDRGWLYQFDKRKSDSLLKRGASRSMIAEREEVSRRSLSETVRQLNTISEDFFDTFELIYRPHPGTHAEGIENPRVHIVSDLPIGTWIQHIDLLLVWGSTTAFEAEMADVPVLRHEAFENSATYRAHGLDRFAVIDKFDEITLDLIRSVSESEAEQDVYKEFYGSCDGTAISQIGKAVEDILLSSEKGVEVVFDGPYRYRLARKEIFEMASRVAVRLGLVHHLKRPRITYNLYSDIPYVKKT